MSGLREARAAAVQKHLRALEDDWRKALPRLLDELDTIDREHVPTGIVAAEGELTEEQVTELRNKLAEVAKPKPAARRRART